MTSVEARAEAEWRFPVTAYECPEDQATEVERFVAGAEWQAERDAERVAKLETEVERLNDALDAADVRYQMLGDWGDRMKAEAERVAELEAEVEEWRRVAVEQTRLERDRAEAAEAKIAESLHVIETEKHWNESCGWDVPAIRLLAVLDGGDDDEQ